MTRAEIVAAARGYLGTPYLHQGRSRDGIDCLGLIVCVLRDLGIEVRDVVNYTQPDCETLYRALGEHLTEIPTGEARSGDVVVFRLRSIYAHQAFLTPDGMIHAYDSPSAGRVVEHGMGNWGPRMEKAYRLPGVID